MVIACPIALCGLSGATTTTSPNSFITSIKARIPGATMLSSLVTSISGFDIFCTFFAKLNNLCRNLFFEC